MDHRVYLHKNPQNQIILSTFKIVDGHRPLNIKRIYKDRIPLYAPWFVDLAKGYLKLVLERTMKTVLIDDVVNIYVFSNDVITKTNPPKDKILNYIGKSVCPPQLESHRIVSKTTKQSGYSADNVSDLMSDMLKDIKKTNNNNRNKRLSKALLE